MATIKNDEGEREITPMMTVLMGLCGCLSSAELTGSRGRARFYGRPEPPGDWDFTIFTDDDAAAAMYARRLQFMATDIPGSSFIPRPDGCTLHVPGVLDISVYPTIKRRVMRRAWAYLETTDITKDEAWRVAKYALAYPY